MNIPSSNLLSMALTVIQPTTFKLFAFIDRDRSAKGQFVSNFAEGIDVLGSIQAVPRSRYQNLGLDFNKNYIQIYTSSNVIDLRRDSSGDQIEWNGRRYEISSNNDWHAIDGWMGVLAIDIGAIPHDQ